MEQLIVDKFGWGYSVHFQSCNLSILSKTL